MSEENKKDDEFFEGEPWEPSENKQEDEKPLKKVSLSAAVFSAIALVIAAVMLTYTLCSAFYKRELVRARLDNVELGSNEALGTLEVLNYLFDRYSYFDIEDEQVVENVLRAYVAATGDTYAYYYNAEEYEALQLQTAGNLVGIGITVVDSSVTVEDTKYDTIAVVAVADDSPAKEAGLQKGDLIAWIGVGENKKLIGEIGYQEATSSLRGEEGSIAEFTILRPVESGYEEKEFSVKRRAVEGISVYYSVSEADPNIGIVKIAQFDLTVPRQFSKALDELISKGCKKFVFDVRYNGGGDLASITAVLSYLLNEGDVLLSTEGSDGTTVITTVEPVNYTKESYKGCNVSKKDIGKYRDLIEDMVVLCNEGTASAAELFTATLRDYELADIIGTKTYGKGSMQTVFPLDQFGYGGALKLTTKMYFPPCAEGYDGIGIAPNYEVELSEAAKEYNIYLLPQSIDDQLMAAINDLNK